MNPDRIQLVKTLQRRREQLVKLRDLDAPPFILENQEKLVRQAEGRVDDFDTKEADAVRTT